MQLRTGGRLGLILALWLWAALAWADATLDKAKGLLAQQNPKAAFELLMPLQSQRAGEVEYDYLLGIAALDAGDAQQAVFALERVLAVNPNYLQARAEIARAYFVLGERDSARREFEAVKAAGGAIPPEARESIDRYLSALAPQQTEFKAYIELALGYDSNTNSATSRSTIAIPLFNGVISQLNPLGVRQGAWFGGVSAGASVSHPVSDQVALIGALAYGGKFNQEYANNFDTGQVDLSAGARLGQGDDQILAIAQVQRFWVDNQTYRNSLGGTAQWLHNFSPAQQITVFGQYAALRFPDQPPERRQPVDRRTRLLAGLRRALRTRRVRLGLRRRAEGDGQQLFLARFQAVRRTPRRAAVVHRPNAAVRGNLIRVPHLQWH